MDFNFIAQRITRAMCLCQEPVGHFAEITTVVAQAIDPLGAPVPHLRGVSRAAPGA